jgi:hypothetical protein
MKYKVKTFTEKEAAFMVDFCFRFCPGMTVNTHFLKPNRYCLFIRRDNVRQFLTTGATWADESLVNL